MVELMVALVGVLALFAGLLQVASLTKAHTDSMVEARRDAGHDAMTDADYLLDAPKHIRDWKVGQDNRSYTKDDTYTQGNSADFKSKIVDKTTPSQNDWTVVDSITDNEVSKIHVSSTPVSCFGLVKGNDTRTVTVIDAVRDLLYDASDIRIETDVWMTKTKGIY